MFKNIQNYMMESSLTQSESELNALLLSYKLKPCGRNDISSQGWVEPLFMNNDVMTHRNQGRIMICYGKEERILPPSVIKSALSKKIKEFNKDRNRPPSKDEKSELKESVMMELIPKSHIRQTLTYAYIDVNNKWLVVDASSSKKAEALIDLMRKTLGQFDVTLPEYSVDPIVHLTNWMQGSDLIPFNLEVQDYVELRGITDTVTVISCKKVDVSQDDIQAHITNGRQVFRLELCWNDQLTFIIHDDMTLHGLKFLDIELEGEDDATRFDEEFDIMTTILEMALVDVDKAFNQTY